MNLSSESMSKYNLLSEPALQTMPCYMYYERVATSKTASSILKETYKSKNILSIEGMRFWPISRMLLQGRDRKKLTISFPRKKSKFQ